MAKATGISVVLTKQNRTETANADETRKPKRRKSLTTKKPKRCKPLTTQAETAYAADNEKPKRRKPLTTRTKTTQVAETKGKPTQAL